MISSDYLVGFLEIILTQWLETLSGVTERPSQWYKSIHFLSYTFYFESSLFFLISYCSCLIFSFSIDTLGTSTTLEFILMNSSHCIDMVWQRESIHICTRFYFDYNRLSVDYIQLSYIKFITSSLVCCFFKTTV